MVPTCMVGTGASGPRRDVRGEKLILFISAISSLLVQHLKHEICKFITIASRLPVLSCCACHGNETQESTNRKMWVEMLSASRQFLRFFSVAVWQCRRYLRSECAQQNASREIYFCGIFVQVNQLKNAGV